MNINEYERAKIVRCIKDPMLPGQKPKQAVFVPDIPDCDAYLHTPTGNVWFHFHKFGRRMMIGLGNIEMVELYPEIEAPQPKTIHEAAINKPRGRPKAVESSGAV